MAEINLCMHLHSFSTIKESIVKKTELFCTTIYIKSLWPKFPPIKRLFLSPADMAIRENLQPIKTHKQSILANNKRH